MTLQVPPELEGTLARLAAQTGRTVDQVARYLLVGSVDHDGCFRRAVEEGRASGREGRLLDHEQVALQMGARYRGGRIP